MFLVLVDVAYCGITYDVPIVSNARAFFQEHCATILLLICATNPLVDLRMLRILLLMCYKSSC